MTTETAYEWLTDFMGMAFVQPGGPATITYPLLCHLVGDTDEPQGDVTTTLCRTADGRWETAHRSQAAPSSTTFSIEVWLAKTRMWLQRLLGRRCPFPVYIQHSECPPWDVFLNYDSGQVFKWPFITSRGKSNVGLQRGDEGQAPTQVNQTYELSAEPSAPEYWNLVHTRRSIAEAEPLRDIAFCNVARCVSGCGGLEDECQDGIIVADQTTSVADVWFSTDYGVTWASNTGPFVSGEDINSATCFYTGRDSVRHVVMRGTTDGTAPPEIGYSDDAGTAWTTVDIGAAATNGDYGLHSGGLFSLDQNHIWAVTDGGDVFFSDDAAVTWTDQGAPEPGAGVQELYYIHFIDERYGWAVGDARHMVYTTDGGDHWAIVITTEGSASDIYTCVATIDRNRAFVGGRDTGGTAALFYYTADAGTNWTSYLARLELAVDGGTITHIGDVMFYDEFAGAVTGTWNDGTYDYKMTWRTFNGGWDWEAYYATADAFDTTTQEYQGGNAVWICNYNQIFSVGAPSDSTGTVEELSPLGSV